MNKFASEDRQEMNVRQQYKRHPDDSRIALVDRIEDAPRIGGVFNAYSGVICPYSPFTDDEYEEIMDYGQSRMRKGLSSYFRPTPGCLDNAPQSLIDLFNDMHTVFNRLTGITRRGMIRLNSRFPSEMHAHEASLTYTLGGSGTIVENKRGKHYGVPEKHIFVFGRRIWHKAPQILPPDGLRLTIVI